MRHGNLQSHLRRGVDTVRTATGPARTHQTSMEPAPAAGEEHPASHVASGARMHEPPTPEKDEEGYP